MKKEILELLERSAKLGLCEESITDARDFVEYNEYELALDTLLVQLYEYDINIDKIFYDLVISLISKMKLNKSRYMYLKELYRNNLQ